MWNPPSPGASLQVPQSAGWAELSSESRALNSSDGIHPRLWFKINDIWETSTKICWIKALLYTTVEHRQYLKRRNPHILGWGVGWGGLGRLHRPRGFVFLFFFFLTPAQEPARNVCLSQLDVILTCALAHCFQHPKPLQLMSCSFSIMFLLFRTEGCYFCTYIHQVFFFLFLSLFLLFWQYKHAVPLRRFHHRWPPLSELFSSWRFLHLPG